MRNHRTTLPLNIAVRAIEHQLIMSIFGNSIMRLWNHPMSCMELLEHKKTKIKLQTISFRTIYIRRVWKTKGERSWTKPQSANSKLNNIYMYISKYKIYTYISKYLHVQQWPALIYLIPPSNSAYLEVPSHKHHTYKKLPSTNVGEVKSRQVACVWLMRCYNGLF